MNFESSFIGRPSTIRVQRCLFKLHIKPYIKKETLTALVQRWQKAKLSPRTIKQLISLSSRYYRFKGLADTESSALCKIITRQIPPSLPKALTKKQAQRLIIVWEETEPKHTALLTLGLHGGVRIGEAFGLQWEDIDFVQGKIQILRSYDGPTKSGRGRIIPMSRSLEQTLIKSDNYMRGSTDQFVFKRFNVNPKLKRACKKADIKPITYHALRHTFATLALESGQSIKAVSTILGHASVKTTLDIYWNILSEKLDLSFIE